MATSVLPDALWNLIESFLPGPDAQSPRWEATPVRSRLRSQPPFMGLMANLKKEWLSYQREFGLAFASS